MNLVIWYVQCVDALVKILDDCEYLEHMYIWHHATIAQADALKLVTCLAEATSKLSKLKSLVFIFGTVKYDNRREFSTAVANAVQVFRFRPTQVNVNETI